ncbi:glycosyltransferase family 2 protein [Flavobacterium sp.]|uniref:glycosyltransferase family 2 protein n=1 Tax=Flavobacterium sp. TaxID=239 RepID=UPI00263531DA|nr:glycosyltransferase family 2 protein [Flavobacterium sp.]
MIDVSIIIINYNTSLLTYNCVVSIIETTPKNMQYEIIVVDNASRKDDFHDLEEKLKVLQNSNIQLIRSRINTGFASGNMFGVQFASGKYLAFINNDVELTTDSFTALDQFFKQNPDTGVIGIQPIFADKRKQVAFGHFDTFSNRFFGYWLYEKLNPNKAKRHKTYTEPIQADYVVGSFMFFKSEHFNAVGGFDTNIFLYFEEMDICKRLLNNNLKTIFYPSIDYIHINGASTNLGYTKKIELKISHLYIVRKNHGFFSYALLKTFFVLIFFFKSLFNPKHFRLFFKLITLGPPMASSIRHLQKIQ